jgi:hypothetical protein
MYFTPASPGSDQALGVVTRREDFSAGYRAGPPPKRARSTTIHGRSHAWNGPHRHHPASCMFFGENFPPRAGETPYGGRTAHDI